MIREYSLKSLSDHLFGLLFGRSSSNNKSKAILEGINVFDEICILVHGLLEGITICSSWQKRIIRYYENDLDSRDFIGDFEFDKGVDSLNNKSSRISIACTVDKSPNIIFVEVRNKSCRTFTSDLSHRIGLRGDFIIIILDLEVGIVRSIIVEKCAFTCPCCSNQKYQGTFYFLIKGICVLLNSFKGVRNCFVRLLWVDVVVFTCL